MNKNKKKLSMPVIVVIAIAAIVILFNNFAYITYENEYSVIKQFGKIVKVNDEAGLNYKLPIIQDANYISKAVRMYDLNPSEVITSDKCDSYARCEVRIGEIFQSINIIRQAAAKIPDTEINVPVKGFPNGEAFFRVEQPRGEAFYYVRANGTKFLDRMRIRTPTFANLMAMVQTLQGCQYGDVPLLVLTIDPCISCTER